MGIPLSTPATTQDFALQELGGLTYEEKMGGGRFLKTLRCTTNDAGHAPVVVKVFLKGVGTPSLAPHAAQLREIRARLPPAAAPNVLPFALFRETEKAAFLMRQYLHSTLRERVAAQPALNPLEILYGNRRSTRSRCIRIASNIDIYTNTTRESRIMVRWLAFQLLCALEQMHLHGVCHGDIKAENALLTSWDKRQQVYLTLAL
ncbi:hypothetical protein T492DRAFT_1150940 [Pavlovales sp. CCMP2436]|nr:hypothetical protein T492DRAFT_1150940 [Pavlovales sp. CCMP2436]